MHATSLLLFNIKLVLGTLIVKSSGYHEEKSEPEVSDMYVCHVAFYKE